MNHIQFPFQFDENGLTATSNEYAHIRQMIEQILFTNPGERVNRPTFGSGLLQAVFEPNSSEMAATTQYLIQSSLNQWLGNSIEVNEVEVSVIDSTLEVIVSYTILLSKESEIASFKREL